MHETTLTGEFIELEFTMQPAPPGTKASPRPPGRPREIYNDGANPPPPPNPQPPTDQPPEQAAKSN